MMQREMEAKKYKPLVRISQVTAQVFWQKVNFISVGVAVDYKSN